jgi:hypothetical protein
LGTHLPAFAAVVAAPSDKGAREGGRGDGSSGDGWGRRLQDRSWAVSGAEILGRGGDANILLRWRTAVIRGGDGVADLEPTMILRRDGDARRRPRPVAFKVGRVWVVLCP